MNFDELDIYQIGNSIRLTGVIYSDKDSNYCFFLPDDGDAVKYQIFRDMTLEEWKRLIRQTDLLETEIIASAADGKTAKIILRKSVRQVDQRVAWKVFERDSFKCRYCGKTGIPLTVDHLILWEEGGPTVERNLLSACRKCNKQRGSTEYREWIESELYRSKSKNLTNSVKLANLRKIDEIKTIEKVRHKKSR